MIPGALTYLLTPWCRVLLEKPTGLQLVKKFPAFHGTRMFITAVTSLLNPSLSWANPIQSIYPHPTSWRSILILSTHLRLGLPSGLFFYSIEMPSSSELHSPRRIPEDVRPRQRIQRAGSKTNQPVLCREIIAVCSQIHTKHTNTLCG